MAWLEYSYQDPLLSSSLPRADDTHLLSKEAGIRAVTGVTSALSIFGSCLIILSYLCFRKLRTAARLILVHLSIADLGVGLANLVGDAVNFDQYYHNLFNASHPQGPSQSIDNLCKAQAFFAEYFTLSSVLWTICLAVHMYMLIVSQSRSYLKYLMWFFYPFCYLLPLLVSVWMLATGRLGYAPYDSAGWCSIISIKPYYRSMLEIHDSHIDFFSDFFGYYLWIYLTSCLIFLLYISAFCFIRQEFRESKKSGDSSSKEFWRAMDSIDYKFILIPLMFILLRIWSILIHVILVYGGLQPDNVSSLLLQILVYFSGFGDSGQGFVNAILFVLFSKNVRQHLKSMACRCCRKKGETESLLYQNQTVDPFINSRRYNATYSSTDDKLSLSSSVSDHFSTN